MMGSGRRRLALAAALIGVVMLAAAPALAHGEEDEAGAVELVKQALAIVVNTPAASGEALERVEAALDAEAEEPSGELDIASLKVAADALEAGDLHEAEDALVTALGVDPHAGADDPTEVAAAPPQEPAADPAEVPEAELGGPPAGEEAGEADDGHAEEVAVGQAAEADDGHGEEASGGEAAAHGLTERVDGGFRAPVGTAAVALAAAALLVAGGLALVFKKNGVRT
ncbi:MAG: hypothetical protein BMS9Abin07_1341 [Acidimicrobiia bacterium]|nr:MAG: hypothetical protein BMS9Abin07_1341 [Acidimicrobiia bacterium]